MLKAVFAPVLAALKEMKPEGLGEVLNDPGYLEWNFQRQMRD